MRCEFTLHRLWCKADLFTGKRLHFQGGVHCTRVHFTIHYCVHCIYKNFDCILTVLFIFILMQHFLSLSRSGYGQHNPTWVSPSCPSDRPGQLPHLNTCWNGSWWVISLSSFISIYLHYRRVFIHLLRVLSNQMGCEVHWGSWSNSQDLCVKSGEGCIQNRLGHRSVLTPPKKLHHHRVCLDQKCQFDKYQKQVYSPLTLLVSSMSSLFGAFPSSRQWTAPALAGLSGPALKCPTPPSHPPFYLTCSSGSQQTVRGQKTEALENSKYLNQYLSEGAKRVFHYHPPRCFDAVLMLLSTYTSIHTKTAQPPATIFFKLIDP